VPRLRDQVLRLFVGFRTDFLCSVCDVHTYPDDADGHWPQSICEGGADRKACNQPQAPRHDLFDDFIEHGRSPCSLVLEGSSTE